MMSTTQNATQQFTIRPNTNRASRQPYPDYSSLTVTLADGPFFFENTPVESGAPGAINIGALVRDCKDHRAPAHIAVQGPQVLVLYYQKTLHPHPTETWIAVQEELEIEMLGAGRLRLESRINERMTRGL